MNSKKLPLNVGIDYDGTFTAIPEHLTAFMAQLRASGHRVYIVTMRYPSENKDMHESLPQQCDGIYFTSRLAKAPYMLSHGINIHIWIDDHPQAIEKDASQIWDTVLPEGKVHSKTHDAEYDSLAFEQVLHS